jgi:hypothetical protein
VAIKTNAVQFVESQPTFRENISPPSSWSRNKASKIPQRESKCTPPAFTLVTFLDLFFDPEDEGDMFLRNVG